MSTGGLVAIVIVALIGAIVLFAVMRSARNKRLDSRREKARELRREAQQRDLRAQREQALADEQAALAKRAQAEAQLRAQKAEQEGRFAREHHEKATSVDPDADESGAEDNRTTRTTG